VLVVPVVIPNSDRTTTIIRLADGNSTIETERSFKYVAALLNCAVTPALGPLPPLPGVPRLLQNR